MPTIHFGTDEVEDLTYASDEYITVVRVYENKTCHHFCNHRHKSRKAAAKCARDLGRGIVSGGGSSKVVVCTPVHALKYKNEFRRAMAELQKGKKPKVKKASQELLMEALRDNALKRKRRKKAG